MHVYIVFWHSNIKHNTFCVKILSCSQNCILKLREATTNNILKLREATTAIAIESRNYRYTRTKTFAKEPKLAKFLRVPTYSRGWWWLKSHCLCSTCCGSGALPRNNLVMGASFMRFNIYNRLVNACKSRLATGLSCLCSTSEKAPLSSVFFSLIVSKLIVQPGQPM